MKLEKILALGVAEDIAKKIAELSDAELAAEAAKLTDKEAELTMANDKIKELNETVKKFDGVDVEKLKADLEAANKKYADDMEAVKIDNALDVMVTEAGAVDKEIVKSQLDRNIIKRDGDKLIGVSEQLEKLKADKAFLFGAASAKKSDTGMTAQLGEQHNTSPTSGSGEVTLASGLKEFYNV